MKTLIKTDFEKWLQSQLIEDDKGFYLLVGANKVYFYFEGEDGEMKETYVRMQIVPSDTTTPATGVKFHSGKYKFFIYHKTILTTDKISDEISSLLDEITIEETQSFRIDLGVVSTKARGNKFYGSPHYENIIEIPFSHWSM